MIELDNSNGDGLVLLRLQHHLLECGVFDDLVRDNRGKVPCFCHIPPVVTVERSIQIVPQTLYNDSQLGSKSNDTYLQDLEQLLLFKYGIFKINRDFLLLVWQGHSLTLHIFAKLARTEAVHRIEAPHDSTRATHSVLRDVGVRELALHEHLGVLARLGAQLDLSLVHRFERGRELRLGFISIQSTTGILALATMHGATVALWAKCRLRMDVRRRGLATVRRLEQIIIMSRLAPLVEWVLTTARALPWLHRRLKAASDVRSLRAGKHLLAVLLEHARQLHTWFHTRASRLGHA